MYTFNEESKIFYVQQLRDSFNEQDVPDAPLAQAISEFPFSEHQATLFSSKSPQLVDILLPGTDLSRRPDAREPQPAQLPLPYHSNSNSDSLDQTDVFVEDFDEEVPRDLLQDTMH